MFPFTVMRRMEKINSTRLPNGIHSGIFPLQEEEGRGNDVQICISKLHTMKCLTLYISKLASPCKNLIGLYSIVESQACLLIIIVILLGNSEIVI